MVAVSATLFVSMMTCMVIVASGTHYPDVLYVADHCSQTIVVHSDVRIQLSASMTLNPSSNCLVYLKPHQGSAVVAKFSFYSMPSDYANDDGNCLQESIQLTDSNGNYVLGYVDYCSRKTPPYQYNLLKKGTFGYQVPSFYSVYTATVDLLVSEVVYKQDSCPSGYFDCENTFCVTMDSVCNGFDDCGNNMDETSGCDLAIGVIVGIVVGVIAFVFIVVVLSLLFRRYRQRALYVQYQ
ncbi:hypothetical protein BsWGS_11562 [Bradybaena similaris]